MQAGNYWGQIISGATVKASTGTPEIDILVCVTHQEVGGEYQEIQQVDRTIRMYLSAGARDYTLDKLQRVQFNGDFSAPDFGEQYKTRGISLVLKHEDYKGKQQERWDFAGQTSEPAPADVCAELKAWYKAKTGKQSKPSGKPKPPTSPAPTKDAEHRKSGYVDADAPGEPENQGPATDAEMDAAKLPY